MTKSVNEIKAELSKIDKRIEEKEIKIEEPKKEKIQKPKSELTTDGLPPRYICGNLEPVNLK